MAYIKGPVFPTGLLNQNTVNIHILWSHLCEAIIFLFFNFQFALIQF